MEEGSLGLWDTRVTTKEIRHVSEATENTEDCSWVSEFALATALTILSLTNMNFDLAVSWLTDPHRRGLRLAPDITRDRVQRVLED